MGLAVSYTNEGYDSTAYRTLERWLSVKYPSGSPSTELSDPAEVGFTDRASSARESGGSFHQGCPAITFRRTNGSRRTSRTWSSILWERGLRESGRLLQGCVRVYRQGLVNRESQLHLLWNRLGATLANSGRSEDAIKAYCKALEVNPNFVRARYNLGVSCINIGCYPEAAGHLLGALNLHRIVSEQGMEKAREIVVMDRQWSRHWRR